MSLLQINHLPRYRNGEDVIGDIIIHVMDVDRFIECRCKVIEIYNTYIDIISLREDIIYKIRNPNHWILLSRET